MQQQLSFNMDAVQPIQVSGSAAPLRAVHGPGGRLLRPADALMASDGAWAFGETAERCFMRLAGKTIRIRGAESKTLALTVPFTTVNNKALVGWGAGGQGRIYLADDAVARAWVGRHGINEMSHINGRLSAYWLQIEPEVRPLEKPIMADQAEALSEFEADGRLKGLEILVGRHVSLRFTGQDPVVKGLRSQFLLVKEVQVTGSTVNLLGDGWSFSCSGVIEARVDGGEIHLFGSPEHVSLDLLGQSLAAAI